MCAFFISETDILRQLSYLRWYNERNTKRPVIILLQETIKLREKLGSIRYGHNTNHTAVAGFWMRRHFGERLGFPGKACPVRIV